MSLHKVGFPVYILLNVQVGKAVKLAAQVVDLLTQAVNKGGCRTGGVFLVLVRKFQQLVRPICGHNVFCEYLGKVGGKGFFADIRLRTVAFLFGTTIVDMAFLLLGGDAHTALAAFEKPAKGFYFFLICMRVSSSGKDDLNFVEKMFVYERRMLALVYFPAVAKMSIVERIDENKSRSVFV